MAGGIGGIIASTTFRQVDAPFYNLGIWVTIGAQILLLMIQAVLVVYFMMRNKEARRGGRPIENTPGFFYQI